MTALAQELSNLAFWVGIFAALAGVVFLIDRAVRVRKRDGGN